MIQRSDLPRSLGPPFSYALSLCPPGSDRLWEHMLETAQTWMGSRRPLEAACGPDFYAQQSTLTMATILASYLASPAPPELRKATEERLALLAADEIPEADAYRSPNAADLAMWHGMLTTVRDLVDELAPQKEMQ